ncbi:MAG: pantetheine-phosphate adenylyltransferase [Bacteroidaceae bacterium]|nr:pantetheine-phosphate adenylyltransferase [Bacteroidaceae bacterium]
MKLLFPGSFDPFTTGHADLVERALKIAGNVVIAIGTNSGKNPMFSVGQRLDAIARHYAGDSRVSVISYDGLTVDAVRENGCDAILRGVRTVADYEAERSLADANRAIEDVETVLLVARADTQHISSSLVRELMHYGRDVSGFVIETFLDCMK